MKLLIIIIFFLSSNLFAEERLLQKYNNCILENSKNLDDVSVLQQNCYEKHLIGNLTELFGRSEEQNHPVFINDYEVTHTFNNNQISNGYFNFDVKKYGDNSNKSVTDSLYSIIKPDLVGTYEIRFGHNIENYIVEKLVFHIGNIVNSSSNVYLRYIIDNAHIRPGEVKVFHIKPYKEGDVNYMLNKDCLKTREQFSNCDGFPYAIDNLYGIKIK